MNFLAQITVLVLTYNEAENIGRTLDETKAFPKVIVLDSGSTDETRRIVESYSNTKWHQRPFDNHAAQWNYGLGISEIDTPWILCLDADYVLSKNLVSEIASLDPLTSIGGYRAAFRYCIYGHKLSGNLYPPVVALFRRDGATYVQSGHTQRLKLSGDVGQLTYPISHDDRKPLRRWLTSQISYAALEAEHLSTTRGGELRPVDRIRLLAWPAPILAFVYTLVVKRCLLDGWPGWFYASQRALAEFLIALELMDRRIAKLTSSVN